MTLSAIVHLGYYFFKRLIVRAFTRREGLAQFRINYAGEALLPVRAERREAVTRLGGCIACGMCDATFASYERAARSVFRGPSDLPLSYSRSFPDYDALDDYIVQIKKGDLARLEAVCPARVPFTELVAFVEEHASDIPRELPRAPTDDDSPATDARHDPG